MPRTVHRVVACCVTVLAIVGRVRAHGGETTGPHDAPLAIGLFVSGVVLVGTSVFVDATREANRRYVDAGVVLGILVGLAGIAAYWV